MKVIFKYTVSVQDSEIELTLPKGSRVVHVGNQEPEHVTLWVEQRPDRDETETRKFRVYGTGHGISESHKYLGTTQDGPFIWHLYEVMW